jgi:purine nucleosidase
MMHHTSLHCYFLIFGLAALAACRPTTAEEQGEKIRIILDTDANNELDDQHAMAYLFFNPEVFSIEGVTVNATSSGGDIDEQYTEAERVMRLCGVYNDISLLKGADGDFETIRPHLVEAGHDGAPAVDFIIRQAMLSDEKGNLTLLAVGKLTNVALALEKEPAIASRMRVVWLGSNYPDPGEYNQNNDIAAMNYMLATETPFEMVTVRYGKPSGTDAVRVTQAEINARMPGKGPRVSQAVVGRHGGQFHTFGDYSVSLFKHIQYHGDPPSRALFDMAAAAILKNPAWARSGKIPAPVYTEGQWVEQPDNPRQITVWEHFDRDAIIADFYASLH